MAAALAALALVALGSPAGSSAQPQAPPGFFGVNASGYEPGDFARMAAAGAGVTRNVFPFQLLKHGRQQPYNWSYSDLYVQQTAIAGIELVPMIYGAPPWISKKLKQTVYKGEAKREWRGLLVALVQRYGPGGSFWAENPYTPYRPIRIWQIWNEPNSITWWGPRPKPTQYAKVLVRSAKAIRSVDPGAEIMTAGIVARPSNRHAIAGTKYLKRLFGARGVKRAVDIVAYHPFAESVNGIRRQLKAARRTLKRRRARTTPIWATEIGWGSKGKKHQPLIKRPGAQNRALRDLMEMAIAQRRRLGLERLLWFQWRDTPSDLCRWCRTSGLLETDGQPKRLLDTFAAIAGR